MPIFGLKFSVDDAIKVSFLGDPLLELESELELKLTDENLLILEIPEFEGSKKRDFREEDEEDET